MLDLESVMDYLSPFAKYLGGASPCQTRVQAGGWRVSIGVLCNFRNVSIMAVVDDRSRENAKYPRERRERGGGGGEPRCILSRPIYIYIYIYDIYIYIYTTANISPLDLTPRELGWSIANNQFGNRRFQSVTSLGRGGGVEKKRWARYN